MLGALSYYLRTRKVDKYYCPCCENTFNYPEEDEVVDYVPYGMREVAEIKYIDVCPYCGEDDFEKNDVAWRGKLKGKFEKIKRIRRATV